MRKNHQIIERNRSKFLGFFERFYVFWLSWITNFFGKKSSSHNGLIHCIYSIALGNRGSHMYTQKMKYIKTLECVGKIRKYRIKYIAFKSVILMRICILIFITHLYFSWPLVLYNTVKNLILRNDDYFIVQ